MADDTRQDIDEEEIPLRCPSCGEEDCLGLCRDLLELALQAPAGDEPNQTPGFWLTDEGHWPPGR